MKLRHALALVTLISALAPMSARATHCDNPIYIFSSRRVDSGVEDPTKPGTTIGRSVPPLVSSAIGCTPYENIGSDPTTDPVLDPATNTDYIYPQSDRMFVRLILTGQPNPDPAIVTSAVLEFAGHTYPLTMAQSISITGEVGEFLDSQTIPIDPADTLSGQVAVATICVVDEPDCYTRTYRTIL